ncbi:hypothetical protein E8E13_000539 [Curvularia kusanoi]|uniref:Uncharacterized protein n=1 Tax=Curvularia kusanoi TaxID=90978 RepID=A0A9P4T5L8_CURKU|nr:hypothetical protein E8E13_000539 [Curvularia kusanoi]
MTVMEDKERFAGADTHTIREAFQEWVIDDLPPRVRYPDLEGGIDNIKAILKSRNFDDSEDYRPDAPIHPCCQAPPRWSFCLIVDDFCLRTLDYSASHPDRPMAKLVNLLFLGGRCAIVADGWADGETDDHEEDVGWMYMYSSDYESYYALLSDPGEWDTYYIRPSKEDYPLANALE